MQTIKTAAVVVLMLTVLYGGYVSLTTPPEPLPEEIGDILVIDESGEGAFGSGDALAAGLELSEPPEGVLPPFQSPQSVSPSPQTGSPQTGSSQTGSSQTAGAQTGSDSSVRSSVPAIPDPTRFDPPSTGTYGSSFADLTPKKSSRSNAELSAKKLPEVGVSGPAVTPGPAASYASTPNAYELPDPAVAQAKFDPDRGVAFNGDATNSGFTMSDQPKTALETVAADAAEPAENRGLINAFQTADAMYAKGQLKEALATLSVFYGMPDINASQRRELLSRLDPLAREVIYSRRHLLEQPHRVTASETLVEVAAEYDVPWQLLANINQVDDPVTVLPGTELKTIRGPFRAEVDLTGKQLTLFLGDLYAGRFDIEVGNDPAPTPGTFTVQEKQSSHIYYDPSGMTIPAGSVDNPYGNMWLDLGGQICIHGSPNTVQPTKAGCISVAGDYADDIYGILSQGSSVTIRR